jgi:hypothetical protein
MATEAARLELKESKARKKKNRLDTHRPSHGRHKLTISVREVSAGLRVRPLTSERIKMKHWLKSRNVRRPPGERQEIKMVSGPFRESNFGKYQRIFTVLEWYFGLN